MKRYSKLNVTQIIFYIKEIFNAKNYPNLTFFKVVVSILLVMGAISLFSGIYFSYKVFNFVAERVTSIQDKAHHEIKTKGDSLGYLGHTLIGYKRAEDEAEREIYKEARRKKHQAKLKTDEEKIDKYIDITRNIKYEQAISKSKIWEPEFLYDYLGNCSNNVNRWISNRQAKVKTKEKVVKKYRNELETRGDWNKGEKRALEDYITKYGEIDTDTSRSHLLQILKNQDPQALYLESHTFSGTDILEDLEEMQFCLNKAEDMLTTLYYYWYDYAQLSPGAQKIWCFQQLKFIKEDLGIGENLDFTVPILLSAEMECFRKSTVYLSLDVAQSYIEQGNYTRYIVESMTQIMQIYEAINTELNKIDPNNMGFKTKAYEARMKRYNAWKSLWDKMQSHNQDKINSQNQPSSTKNKNKS